ncbi:hypothetical protein [Scopulibacillus darangshiensis]|nr:hypothetical protein [Scopulibacillus darangshiensis]
MSILQITKRPKKVQSLFQHTDALREQTVCRVSEADVNQQI